MGVVDIKTISVFTDLYNFFYIVFVVVEPLLSLRFVFNVTIITRPSPLSLDVLVNSKSMSSRTLGKLENVN